MNKLKDYCRRHPWCGDLKVAAVFLGLAALGAIIVLQAVPSNLAGN
ncbi:MAG: hypothetical protein GJ677_00780 [Rhodobacteraceae bacterium]|nr:hypothetical protein [Paracoccaceae bacterium]